MILSVDYCPVQCYNLRIYCSDRTTKAYSYSYNNFCAAEVNVYSCFEGNYILEVCGMQIYSCKNLLDNVAVIMITFTIGVCKLFAKSLSIDHSQRVHTFLFACTLYLTFHFISAFLFIPLSHHCLAALGAIVMANRNAIRVCLYDCGRYVIVLTLHQYAAAQSNAQRMHLFSTLHQQQKHKLHYW